MIVTSICLLEACCGRYNDLFGKMVEGETLRGSLKKETEVAKGGDCSGLVFGTLIGGL